MTTVGVLLPEDLLGELDEVAAHFDFSGTPALLQYYVSTGMREHIEQMRLQKLAASGNAEQQQQPDPTPSDLQSR